MTVRRFGIVPAAWLALLVGLAVAWALSYAHYRVDSVDGRLQVGVIHGGEAIDEDPEYTGEAAASNWKENAVRSWAAGGIEWHRCRMESPDHYSTREYGVTLVIVPYWLLMTLAALPPVVAAVLVVVARRRRRTWDSVRPGGEAAS